MRKSLEPWIAREDILRFLHARQGVTEAQQQEIEDALDEVFSCAAFRFVQKEATLTFDGKTPVLDKLIPLPYASLAHLFSDSTTVYVVCCTLGQEIMRRIRRYFVTDAARAVVLDACASVVADAYAACLQEGLPEETGMRFSPGYGDVPLSLQRPLFAWLDATKRTGVSLSAGDLMTPEKSIVFLAGNHPKDNHEPGCDTCGLDCAYRKDRA